MSKAFDQARELVQQDPMPEDIIELLDDLREDIEPDENDKFEWLYEAASLSDRLSSEDQ